MRRQRPRAEAYGHRVPAEDRDRLGARGGEEDDVPEAAVRRGQRVDLAGEVLDVPGQPREHVRLFVHLAADMPEGEYATGLRGGGGAR